MFRRFWTATVTLILLLTGLMPQAVAASVQTQVYGPVKPDTQTNHLYMVPRDEGGVVINKPNIVLVLLDDHVDYFPDFYRLSNLSSVFFQQGISFTNFMVNFSLCCPARAADYTGLRDDHNGVLGNNGAALFDPRESIFTELQSVGYSTHIFGKWFNGTNTAAINRIRGIDSFAIKNAGQYYNYPLWVKDQSGITETHYGNSPSDYSTRVLSQYASSLLQQVPANQPVFLDLAPNATHGGPDATGHKDGIQPVVEPRYQGDPRCQGIPPYDPASFNEADVSDKPAYIQKLPLYRPIAYKNGWPMEKACESLLSVDDWFGQTVDWLKATGRYDNTIFILTSDNGMGWGAHRIEGKIAPETVQVPFIVSMPGQMTAFTQNDTLLTNVDIAPTLCEFAGCTMGPYFNYSGPPDGESFAGLVIPGYLAPVLNRQSIVIEGKGGYVPWFQGIITVGKWMEVYYPNQKYENQWELYDLSGGQCIDWQVGDPGDPCMLNNVAYQNIALRTTLKQQFDYDWAHGSY